MSISMARKDFIKASTAAAGGLALAGVAGTGMALANEGAAVDTAGVELPKGILMSDIEASAVELEPVTEFAAEESYDLVVVGAGCAGVPAILTAVEEGATVGVLQKGDFVLANGTGCTAIIRSHSTDAGYKRFMYDFAELNDFRMNMGLFQYWADHSEEMESWLVQKTHEAGLEMASASTSSTIVYDDGEIAAIGGCSQKSNQDTMTALAELAESKGAVFHYSTPCVQLVQDEDGTVTGAIGKQADGTYIKLNAAKGVILAAGDYMNNESLTSRYSADIDMFWRKQTNRTGDGHILASLAGSQIVPANHAHQIHGMIPGFMTTPLLILDWDGQRFMNESVTMTIWNTQMIEHYHGRDDSTIYRFFDAAVEDKYTDLKTSLEGINKSIDEGTTKYYTRADSIEELAEAVGLPVDNVVASIERWNELCASGDVDFGVYPDKMKPIDTPPYYCITDTPGLAAINGGVYVDDCYRVTTAAGEVIPNLFAAGVDAGNLCGGMNWAMPGGCSDSHCFTAGRYTAILALTGGLEPSNPCTFEQVADEFAGKDGTFNWENGKARSAIEVW